MMIPFVKMVGTGNDFLIVDARARVGPVAKRWPAFANAACDRRYGVGADGVLVLERSRIADVRMRIFNPDGSEAQMCGNGARCVAWYVAQASRRRRGVRSVWLETIAGVLPAEVSGDLVRIRMTPPTDLRLDMSVPVAGRSVRLGFVNTGVPHAVVRVPDIEEVDVQALGRLLRHHQAFRPKGANVNFIQASGPSKVRVRTYERGVEGETLACGTGVTAAAIIHALSRPQDGARDNGARHIHVQTRSGESLTVHVDVPEHGDGAVGNVVLEGAVRWVCRGEVAWPTTGRA